MKRYNITEIKGVIPATLTFFDENELVDERRTRDMIEFMLSTGVDGFYLTGSTGMCFTMTLEERKRVVEIVVDQVQGRVPIIVHVGDIGTKKSIELAQHAERVGADAISSVPPFYWKFGAENIYQYYKEIAESTSLPLIVYNIQLAGIMDKELLLRLSQIENVKGLKYTARSHDELGQLKDMLGAEFMIYSGCDEMAFSGLAFGADGIIGSFYNAIPEVFLSISKCVKENKIDEGIQLQKIANEFIFACLEYDFPSCLYQVLRWRNQDAGYGRKPFLQYTEEQLASLKSKLEEIQKQYPIKELNMFSFS